MRIDSAKSAQVKHVAALQKKARTRREEGCFVVEGIRMVAEAPADRLEAVYASDSFLSAGGAEKLSGISYIEVSDTAFKAMAETQTPQGVLAVVRMKPWEEQEIYENPNALLVILENLQDPGNLGTILRAGEGAGVTGVIMSRETVDIYNPKVIRSTMGSIYRVPFLIAEDLSAAMEQCHASGIRTCAAHLDGTMEYDRADYREKSAFLIGNEAAGLSDKLSGQADTLVKIPMMGQVESLNAAVAASVLLYEAARQRRNAVI
ncbi:MULTISPECIES: TrmH family RNA methyltransferase [unclassified Candidatus Paralachnospira]|uniref:TrmH family RNA methyltransferase n=1 Tax=unclassified Candidatus Paralachnospira TaxID=3099471 RepID=UPI003F935D7E